MADVVYRVEFVGVEALEKTKEQTPSDPEQKQEMLSNKPKSTEEITKKETNRTKEVFTKFVSAYGAYQIVSNIMDKNQVYSSLGRGDNLKATMQAEQNATRNSLINSGLSLIGGAVLGGLPGLALAGGVEIYKYVQQSINVGMQNSFMISQLMAERQVAINNQERFVRNATTEKIRSW